MGAGSKLLSFHQSGHRFPFEGNGITPGIVESFRLHNHEADVDTAHSIAADQRNSLVAYILLDQALLISCADDERMEATGTVPLHYVYLNGNIPTLPGAWA